MESPKNQLRKRHTCRTLYLPLGRSYTTVTGKKLSSIHLDCSNVSRLRGAGDRVASHDAHPLEGRGEVEPLEYLEAGVLAPPRDDGLALDKVKLTSIVVEGNLCFGMP